MSIWRLTTNHNQEWNVENSTIKIPANVPGQLQMDLLRSNIIQEPYFQYRDTEYRWIGLDNWKYTTTINVPEKDKFLNGRVLLVCHGLDTVANLYLNGKTIGKSINQFARYIFEINLNPGENALEIAFTSPSKYATQKSIEYPYDVPDGFAAEQSGEKNRNFIRKEQCSFSWDWGPCFLPIGISDMIYLVGLNKSAWISDFTVDISKHGNDFNISIHLWIEKNELECCWVSFNLEAIGYVEGAIHGNDAKFNLKIPSKSVNLWWPAGYGEQPMYKLTASIYPNPNSKDIILSTSEKNIAFRTVELIQDKYEDRKGTSFYFKANGISIFSKGTNWIPADAFECRVESQHLRNLLVSCKEANMNMIRVWGGGIYQSDEFYDICDELGLLVWQEFMFACAMYPVDKEFLDSVSQETNYQVKRLMSHPCIVLWSGNNENEEALMTGWYAPTKTNPFVYAIDYHKLYHDTIMKIVLSLDKTRSFISSSPSNGIISSDPFTERYVAENNDIFGDVHYYNYKDNGADVTKFRSPRFMSEYGFQSMPSFQSLKDVITSNDLNPLSSFWIQRNHHKFGQEEMIHQMKMHFRLPFEEKCLELTSKQFDNFCWLTQCVQAICIKAQTEHYRRLKSGEANCMGALYWQCNDIWQAPTWSSIEYNGNWKVLHYAVKQFFEPVLISSFENSSKEYEIHLTNDFNYSLKGSVNMKVITYNGEIKISQSINFQIEANESKLIYSISSIESFFNQFGLAKSDAFFHFNILETKQVADGKLHQTESCNQYFPSSFKDVTLFNPKIKLNVLPTNESNSFYIEIECEQVAVFVFLESNSEKKGRFTKNAFVGIPGYKEVVQFKTWNRDLNIDEFRENLTARSVWDTNQLP